MTQEYTRCSGQAYDSSGFGRLYRCTKRAVVERNGKPYCKIHDPEYIKAKTKEKDAKWDREWTERKKGLERKSLIASIFKDIDTEMIEANKDKYREAPRLYEALKEVKLVWLGLDPDRKFPHLEEVINQAIKAVEGK